MSSHNSSSHDSPPSDFSTMEAKTKKPGMNQSKQEAEEHLEKVSSNQPFGDTSEVAKTITQSVKDLPSCPLFCVIQDSLSSRPSFTVCSGIQWLFPPPPPSQLNPVKPCNENLMTIPNPKIDTMMPQQGTQIFSEAEFEYMKTVPPPQFRLILSEDLSSDSTSHKNQQKILNPKTDQKQPSFKIYSESLLNHPLFVPPPPMPPPLLPPAPKSPQEQNQQNQQPKSRLYDYIIRLGL